METERPMRGRKVRFSKVPFWYQNGGPIVRKEGNGVICTLPLKTGEECGAELETKVSKPSYTNIETHLTSHARNDPTSYDNWKKKESKIRKKLEGGKQTSILAHTTAPRKTAPPYDTKKPDENKRKMDIDNALTAVFATNINAAYCLIEDPAFILLFRVLDPRYRLPSRRVLSKWVLKLSEDVEAKIRSCLDAADKINVGIDIWSDRKGDSYIGFHGQYFDQTTGSIKTLVLGLELFPHPHDGASVMNIFYQFWTRKMEQKIEKIHRVLADNASNLLAGFKHHLAAIAAKDYEPLEPKTPEMPDGDAQNQTDDLLEDEIEVSDGSGDYALNANPNDHDHVYAINPAAIEDYDFHEAENKKALDQFCKGRHLPCFVHTIQLSITSAKKEEGMKNLLAKCAAIVAAVRCSPKQSQILQEKTGGVILKSYVPTRWTSELTMLESLLKAEAELPNIIYAINTARSEKARKLDLLSPDDWKAIRDTKELLEPFGDCVTEMQSTSVTISKALLYVLTLTRLLRDYQPSHSTDRDQLAMLNAFRLTLLADMNRRFRYVTDPDYEGFDAIWAAATFSDVSLVSRLEEKYVLPAIDYLLTLEPQPLFKAAADAVQITAVAANEPPKAKRSKLSDLMDTYVKSSQPVNVSTQSAPPDTKAQMKAKARRELFLYKDSQKRNEGKNPLEFWMHIGAEYYPTIYKRMLQILSVPATTASVERMFSISGKAANSDRNRLKPAALRAETILVGNKKHLTDLLTKED